MIWIIAVLSACRSETTTETNETNDPEEVGAPTAETGDPGPRFLPAAHLLIDADLCWDSVAGLVEVETNGYTITSAVYLVFGTERWKDSGWDLAQSDEYCQMVLPLTSSTEAAWAAQDPTVWFGVDYTGGVASVLTDCNTPGKQLDPTVFGEDPVATVLGVYGQIGVGIGEWGASWEETWVEAYPDNDLFERYVGARLWAEGSIDPSDFRAYPVLLDPVTHEAQSDGTIYLGLPPEQVEQGEGIATAWYRISSMWVYGL